MQSGIKNIWVNTSFLWLVVISVMGISLRLQPFFPLPFEYKNLLHAHSHLAFLGWIFTSLFTLILAFFLPENRINKKFHLQFWLIQSANLGMLISFPIQGYGFFSIFFSTLHMVISGWFAISLFQTLKEKRGRGLSIAPKFLKAALSFMLLSSAGPLALPVISKYIGAGSALYHNAIYFYLHFQYNGWFFFALLALFFRQIENSGISFQRAAVRKSFVWLTLSCLGTFFLSVLWSLPPFWIWVIAGVSASIQLIAVLHLILVLYPSRKKIMNHFAGPMKTMLMSGIAVLLLKVVLQLASAFPALAAMGGSIRPLVIAYLHLVLLGFVSISLFIFYGNAGSIRWEHGFGRTGLILFAIGFISSESLIVLQGISMYFTLPILNSFDLILAICTGLMPVGFLSILIARFHQRPWFIQLPQRISYQPLKRVFTNLNI